MSIRLVKASLSDADKLWQMQVEAFKELLDKYKDYDTNPASEPFGRTVERLTMPETYYYFIMYNSEFAGAIRVVDNKDIIVPKRISPLWIMPEYRGKGIAQNAIKLAEDVHGSENWELSTIAQEKGNCYLYEKMGYRLTDERKVINDNMTLVFYKK